MAARADLVKEYVENQDRYTTVVDTVISSISSALDRQSISAEVSGRAKDSWSLATKLLTKARSGSHYGSLADIPDLSGVRVIAKHVDDLELIRSLILGLYPSAEEDDKSAQLDADTFRYRGIHFQVWPDFEDSALDGMSCEIQLRTRAEHLWSDLSHELFYKTPGQVPAELHRRFNRLVALIELFDAEVKATMNELSSQPTYESRSLLMDLERQFSKLAPMPVGINRELSLEVISSLEGMIRLQSGISELTPKIDEFTCVHRERLSQIYSRLQGLPEKNPFYMQPESLLLWYLIETHKYDIMDEWLQGEWDPALLIDLSVEWGVALPGWS